MKAPDKIYINVTPLGVDYSIVPIPDFCGVEYIRKDALLEWAEQQEKQAMEELVNGLPLNGKLSAFRRVVEKIESI